jgi:ABC-type antimicrobial peptide transport system permease subunit
MLQNYLKLILRKLAKHRDYAFLNVLGLGLSVGCSILIFALIRHHTNFDTFHQKKDRIMRVVMDIKTESSFPFSGAPNPTAAALRDECTFVEKVAMRSEEDETLISVANDKGGKDKYKELRKFAWIEPGYLDMLDFPLLSGSAADLEAPNTVLVSEKMANKYFGSTNALGKIIRLNNQTDLRVVGILRDLPKNTDYKQEILASWATLKSQPETSADMSSWAGARGGTFCFVLLKEGHAFREMNAVMARFRKDHPHPEVKDLFQYKAVPMLGLHFDKDYGFGMDKRFFWALGMIGLFLLFTACFNFINMATAQALTRGREVGVRKALGSTRGQLFWQFMAETGLIVIGALLVGMLIARLAQPYLNTWLKEDIAFDAALWTLLLGFALVLGILLTFLAGFYPALMQARFNPVISMKGMGEMPGKNSFSLRRVLVSTQFGISQVMIIGAAVITAQMHYAQNVDWGFRPGAILTVDVPEPAKMKTLQTQLGQISGVKNVSLCYQPPASGSNSQTRIVYDNRAEAEQWVVNNKAADANYLETFGLKLIAGRNLRASDTVSEFVVNEAFVKKLNLASSADILNKKVQVGQSKGLVVGVVKDFHNWSLAQEISPIAFSTYSEDYQVCAIQLSPGNPAAVLPQIKKVWENLYPDQYYTQKFMDEQMAEFMETETMLLRLVRTFAGVAIFIGCLGLYGLAAFMVTRKRKEVGIRKTLGASILGILWLFGKEYTRLIAIAFIVAAPLAWWAMSTWLQDYTYRISIGAGVFVLSLLSTFGIAAITVGFQSVKAALANPVKSLRSE